MDSNKGMDSEIKGRILIQDRNLFIPTTGVRINTYICPLLSGSFLNNHSVLSRKLGIIKSKYGRWKRERYVSCLKK